MAVRIRLTRMGKKKQPTYRVVVVDGRRPRDGRYMEQIGRYDPRQEPSLIEIDVERAEHWLGLGAQPSDPVRKLLEIKGVLEPRKVRKGSIHVVGKKAQQRAASEAKAEESVVEEPKVEEAKAEEPKVEEAKVEEAKAEESVVEEAKAEEPKVEEAKVEEAKAEEAKAEEAKVEESVVEEAKVEESKVEEAKVEEPKAEEAKVEEPKPEEEG
jgi:small subunit ribosomal protein S16